MALKIRKHTLLTNMWVEEIRGYLTFYNKPKKWLLILYNNRKKRCISFDTSFLRISQETTHKIIIMPGRGGGGILHFSMTETRVYVTFFITAEKYGGGDTLPFIMLMF